MLVGVETLLERSAAAMSRTRNSKLGSSYFFISRGRRGEVSSVTAIFCAALSRRTDSSTFDPILYCRIIVANRSESDGCDAWIDRRPPR